MAETTHSFKNEKVGSVVAAKMAKTIVVEVIRRVPHPLYKRIISKRRNSTRTMKRAGRKSAMWCASSSAAR
jgi:ribosomal protein S17